MTVFGIGVGLLLVCAAVGAWYGAAWLGRFWAAVDVLADEKTPGRRVGNGAAAGSTVPDVPEHP